MGNAMCEVCGESIATIHMTDIVNDLKSERHLCERCFEEGGVQPLPSVDIGGGSASETGAALFKKVLEHLGERTEGNRRCEDCGTSLSEIRRRGVVGCPRDYEIFGEELEGLLVKLHGGRRHVGRMPKEIETQLAVEHQIGRLELDLGRAVDSEDYEGAASLRDRIRGLRESRHDDE